MLKVGDVVETTKVITIEGVCVDRAKLGSLMLDSGVKGQVLSIGPNNDTLHLQLISEVWRDVEFSPKSRGKLKLYEVGGIKIEEVKRIDKPDGCS